MKRLVDETTDELTRSLLSAGIEHRPPPGNKAQVIVALGAGSAVGLFSSNAFAWLSTTAGKVTAVSVAVGVAGAVWVAAPAAKQASSASPAPNHAVAATSDAPAPSVESTTALASPTAVSPTAMSPTAVSPTAVTPPAVSPPAVATADDAAEVSAPNAPAADGLASSARRERARPVGAKRSSAKHRAAREKVAVAAAARSAAETSPAAEALDEPSAEQAELDTEVRLVDDMHGAARRNDRESLARFLAQYRSAFPDGQLKKEVAEFAARLERSDTSVEN